MLPRAIVSLLPGSIRGRLMLVAGAVTLPAVLLAGWLIYEAQRGYRAVLERQLLETARALSLVVDRQLGQAEAFLQGLATSPHIATGNYEAFYEQARAALPDASKWIVLEDLEGQQLVNTRLPWGAPLPRGPSRPLEYAPQLAEGRTSVSNLLPSRVHNRPILAVVIPLFRQRQLQAVLMVVMLPEHLSSVLADQRVPDDWIASIIDREGTIVARTRAGNLFVGKPATEDVRAAIREQQAAVIVSRTLDGMPALAAFSRSPQFGWTVIVGAPESAILGPAKKLGLMAAVVAPLLVFIGVAASAGVARAILRSVAQLLQGVEQAGRGEEFHAPPTGMRETDRIAEALQASTLALRAREAELRALNHTLEARIAERTKELSTANHTLSIRNRELQDFANVAAHDLQEPARQIRTFADLMAEECSAELSEQGRFYVQRTRLAAERLSRLISDLLALTSISAQLRPLTRVELDAVLANLRGDLETRLRETGGSLHAHGLAAVRADAVQVHHLLLNLVTNALKFHRPGVAPVVHIRTVVEADFVRLIVEDNGVGFDPKHGARLFTPFHRLHARGEFEGNGMGLAIVRRIAERHGGTVAATSELGVGSRFEVTLPAA